MSTVAERKSEQGYRTKPRTCSTCRHRVDVIIHWSRTRSATKEPGLDADGLGFVESRRCGIGDFVVGMFATCDRWGAME